MSTASELSDRVAARADVPVRDAATVVLLRDGPDGLQSWLLTRVKQMVFAAGMTVFPGGRVEPADAELPFAVGATHEAAARFGCAEPTARALVGAAVRETFEETGVLLSEPAAETRIDLHELATARAEVEAGRLSFGELLRGHGLTIAAGALRPLSRWVTPAGEVRRYDTRFFVGALPAGSQAHDVTTESSEARWVGIAQALEQGARGERILLPPTAATLTTLVRFDTVAEAMAATSTQIIEPVRPKLRMRQGRLVSELPDGTLIEIPKSMQP